MRFLLPFLFIFSTLLFAQEETKVDCILLEDENSIICKYSFIRVDFEKNINIQWIDPKGEISRQRDIIIPPLHGSIYDYRYLDGRMEGTWTFQVTDSENIYSTQFTIE